jgi:hypothetical protein
MAKVRRVLGHVLIEVAGAKRKCHHKPRDHAIIKGEVCLVVREASMGGHKNYCQVCALEILDLAGDDLQSLRHSLS